MRASKEQRAFIKGCVKNFLDSKKAAAHTAKEMAQWSAIAWKKSTGEAVKFSPSAVVSSINELRDEGYLISRDVKNRGYRCLAGRVNATPDILGIVESLSHEKGRVASSIENNVIKPGIIIQERIISNIPIGDAIRLVSEMRRTDNLLDEAVGQVKQLNSQEYRLVPVKRNQIGA